jgi:hypothetical protein
MKFKKYIENIENDCEIIKLDPDQRVHTTKQPNIIIKDSPNQTVDLKPKGFWYACGDEWIKWCKGENFRIGDLENKFILDIDFNKILVLDTIKKMVSFNKEYGIDKYVKNGSIDWQKVSERYQGIEICPYQWDLRHDFLWYYGWDIASGCIWNKQAIKNIIKL